MAFDKEMQLALETDGAKLRQLTGKDQGPHFTDLWVPCPDCSGDGEVLEASPQLDDPEFCIVVQCENCGGSGWIRDYPADPPGSVLGG